MNKLKIGVFGTLVAATLFSSCQKDFLDVKPYKQAFEADFFENPARPQELVNASYRSLLDGDGFLSGLTQQVNEIWSDNSVVDANNGNYRFYQHKLGDIFNDPFNGKIMGSMGKVCRDANAAIYGIGKYGASYGDKLPADKQKQIVAEAKFLRSLAHFETVRVFAQPYGYSADNTHLGIGIRNDFEKDVISRASVSEVYAFIEKDLQEAIADLPATAKISYATKNIAKGLLAKVYFQENKYQQAYDLCNDVLNSSGITLDSVAARFGKTTVNSGGLYLLSPQLNSTEVLRNYGLQGIYVPGPGNTAPAIAIDAEVRQLMSNSADTRLVKWFKQAGSDYQLTKFPLVDEFNINYIHWAELKLMRAECAAELSNTAQAAQDLNDVRARAGISVINTTDLAILIRAIRNERRVEMVGEGNRIQDLKRIGAASRRGLTKASETVKVRNAPWDCPGMVLQIPSAEMAASPNYPPNPAGSCN